METILLHNLRLPLGEVEEDLFSIGDVDFEVQFRETQFLDVPVTSKLAEFFKTRGLVTKPGVQNGDDGWPIRVGFDKVDAVSVSDMGYLSKGAYLELGGASFFEILDNPDQLINHNVKLKLEIESLEDDVSECGLKPTVTSHVLDTDFVDEISLGNQVRVKFISTEMDDKLRRNWTNPSSKWYITTSLSLILTPKSEPNPNSDQDFTITGSGAAINCVRNVLAAQSPYFDRMFQSGMNESGSMTLELSHMSRQGVGAMMDYLYFWNKAEPEVNSLICVELLEAGHQYDVAPMEQCMKKILLSKGDEWYTPDAALRLILFLKDMDLDALKVRAIEVVKAKFPEVQALPAYDKLYKESPEVMNQLMKLIVTH